MLGSKFEPVLRWLCPPATDRGQPLKKKRGSAKISDPGSNKTSNETSLQDNGKTGLDKQLSCLIHHERGQFLVENNGERTRQ